MLKKTAGATIKEARDRLGLTQFDLANRSGVSLWTIADIERDRNLKPRPKTVRLICEALELDMDDVLARETA